MGNPILVHRALIGADVISRHEHVMELTGDDDSLLLILNRDAISDQVEAQICLPYNQVLPMIYALSDFIADKEREAVRNYRIEQERIVQDVYLPEDSDV